MASLTQWTWVWDSRELEMDREAWHAVIHGVAKSRTRLSDWTELMPLGGKPWDEVGCTQGVSNTCERWAASDAELGQKTFRQHCWSDTCERKVGRQQTWEIDLVKAMVFPVLMYGCESWTIRTVECQRIVGFELWCWRRLLRVLGLQGAPTSLS